MCPLPSKSIFSLSIFICSPYLVCFDLSRAPPHSTLHRAFPVADLPGFTMIPRTTSLLYHCLSVHPPDCPPQNPCPLLWFPATNLLPTPGPPTPPIIPPPLPLGPSPPLPPPCYTWRLLEPSGKALSSYWIISLDAGKYGREKDNICC